MSGERLQDHWSSGLKVVRPLDGIGVPRGPKARAGERLRGIGVNGGISPLSLGGFGGSPPRKF